MARSSNEPMVWGLLGLESKSTEAHGVYNFVVEYSSLANKLDMTLPVNSKSSPYIIPSEI
jgi:hypothetical protein